MGIGINPRVTGAKPLDNYRIELLFTNKERNVFDVKLYLTIGIFTAPFNGSIFWLNELDLDPDTLYVNSQPVKYCNGLTPS